jgi:hypothetical protein
MWSLLNLWTVYCKLFLIYNIIEFQGRSQSHRKFTWSRPILIFRCRNVLEFTSAYATSFHVLPDLLLPDHSTISRYILRLADFIQLFGSLSYDRSIAFSRASSPQSAVWCNYYSIKRILIKLCAFVASNCKNWIIMHGVENVKCHLVLALWIYSILSFPKGHPVVVYVFFLVFPPLPSFPLPFIQ